jgi:hypothetical protein
MPDRVLVEQMVTTVDTVAGTRQWLDDGPTVEGMVAGGFWQVIDRIPGDKRKTKGPRSEEGDDGGASAVEPDVQG